MTTDVPYSWYNPWPRIGNLVMADKTQAIARLRSFDHITKTHRGLDDADVLAELDSMSASIMESIDLELQLLELISAERMRMSL